jgi:hypothetical protein
MLGYRYEGRFIQALLGKTDQNILDVTDKNVNWQLFQFNRDISLTKNIYEQNKNWQRIERTLPKSLQSFNDQEQKDPVEVDVFILALGSILRYIGDHEKNFSMETEKMKTLINNLEQHIDETTELTVKKRQEHQKNTLLADLSRAKEQFIHFVSDLLATWIRIDDLNLLISSKDDDLIDHMKKDLMASKEYRILVSRNSSPAASHV